jgi:Holliday junction resolvase RusA-like endonuclease
MRNDMINQIKEQMKGQKFGDFCEVGYDFYFTMPKDKKRCQEITTSGMWHSKTDYDNLVKGTQDALEQAGAITDDKILVKHLGGVNKYHTEPYNSIIITINEIKGE